MLICFIPVISDDSQYSIRDVSKANFISKRETKNPQPKELEVRELVWLTYEQLLQACSNARPDPDMNLYVTVRRFLSSFFTEWQIHYSLHSPELCFIKKHHQQPRKINTSPAYNTPNAVGSMMTSFSTASLPTASGAMTPSTARRSLTYGDAKSSGWGQDYTPYLAASYMPSLTSTSPAASSASVC